MVGHKMWLTGAKGRAVGFGMGSADYRYWYIWQRGAFCMVVCSNPIISGIWAVDPSPCGSILAKHCISVACFLCFCRLPPLFHQGVYIPLYKGLGFTVHHRPCMGGVNPLIGNPLRTHLLGPNYLIGWYALSPLLA